MIPVDAAIEDGGLACNEALRGLVARLGETGGTCHLMGLLSPGGVHSHQDQIAALAQLLAGAGIPVAIHAFLDGRDMPPASAADCVAAFQTRIAGLEGVGIATTRSVALSLLTVLIANATITALFFF